MQRQNTSEGLTPSIHACMLSRFVNLSEVSEANKCLLLSRMHVIVSLDV